MRLAPLVAAAIAAAVACLAQSVALAGPMTYQGVLQDSGVPASGTYDIRFDLYDDAAPGAPDNMLDSQTVLGVKVTDGRFTADLSFDPRLFYADTRYIEISCRPQGIGAYTTLLPRQMVSDAPTAWHADAATTLVVPAQLDGTVTGSGAGVLEVENFAPNSGTAIRAQSAWNAITARAGNTSGAPVVTIAPAAVLAVGQETGVSGASNTGVGILGASAAGTAGQFFNSDSSNANPTLFARSLSTQFETPAIHGLIDTTAPGGLSAAVRGENRGTSVLGIGVWGSHDGGGWGVYGTSSTGVGVRGVSGSGDAIEGLMTGSGRAGFFEINEPDNDEPVILARTDSTQASAFGVHGLIESTSPGNFSAAIRGENRGTGGLGIGVHGTHDGSGWGVLGESTNGVGVYGASNTGYAGYFGGDVTVTGSLAKGSGTFKIDHPLDPANRYLSHSFVESPDMKNIYDGVATLGRDGRAEVLLPDYFEALNHDFRYQLTCLGGHAPVFIEREISANTFVIAGGTPGLRVSWQVTGSRRDAYARHNPVIVEEDKPDHERGRYLHPEAHGQSPELSIGRRPAID